MERKKSHKYEEAKNQGDDRNNMTQYLLLCANRPKKSSDVWESNKSEERHKDAVLGDTAIESLYQIRLEKMVIFFPNSPVEKTFPNPPVKFTWFQHLTWNYQ